MSRSHNARRRTIVAALVLGAAALSLAISPAARSAAQEKAEKPKPIRFTAQGINMGSIGGGGGSKIFQITIDRWSTAEERQGLIDAFKAKGQSGLLDALQKSPRIGTIRTSNTLGWDLHYAYLTPLPDGGQRVFMATDRAIAFQEASRSARTMDYPFTLIELRMDKELQKGEGRLSLATKIAVSKDGTRIELENYSSEPVRLQNVKKQK